MTSEGAFSVAPHAEIRKAAVFEVLSSTPVQKLEESSATGDIQEKPEMGKEEGSKRG